MGRRLKKGDPVNGWLVLDKPRNRDPAIRPDLAGREAAA